MRFSAYPKLLSVILMLTQLPSSIQAQSLQDFIRDLTRGGLVNNTPLTSTNNNSNSGAKTDTSLIVDNGDVQTNIVRGSGEFITVKRGDTLSTIARESLGDAKLWREICALNKLDTGCSSIVVGQKLELPIQFYSYRAKKRYSSKITELTERIKILEQKLRENSTDLIHLNLADTQIILQNLQRHNLKKEYFDTKPIVENFTIDADLLLEGTIIDRNLVLVSECSEKLKRKFFLHIYPVDHANLNSNSRFNNHDFYWSKKQLQLPSSMVNSAKKCVSVVKLPNYKIQEISLGQFNTKLNSYPRYWEKLITIK